MSSEVGRAQRAGAGSLKSLTNFLRGIHDEWPISRDGFIQRPAADEKHASRRLVLGRRRDPDFITISLKGSHIAVLDVGSLAAEADRTLNNVGERVEIARYRLDDFAARFEHEI